ncbi:sugar phosphate isomerase/epimerase family protein [Tabrizicola sp.]|uniref:sugar phosphate isomerase/epimerase family protein n=1 Tax=Tabrizicola sp. TaxID=2005166 RepID=UPI003F3161AD
MAETRTISISTVVLDGHEFGRGLELLAIAGSRAVEPAFIEGYTPFDEATFTEKGGLRLGQQIRDAGLTIRAMSLHTDLGREDSAAKLMRRLDFAAAAGAHIVITNATTKDRIVAFERTIALIQPELSIREMVLALENPGHGRDALLPNGTSGAAVVAGLNDPHIRMNYDIGNATSYGSLTANAAADLAEALPVVAHLHLKDFRSVGADWLFCPLGQGSIGYGTAIPLDRLPADLPLGIEHPIRLWRPGRGDPVRRNEVPDEASVIAAVKTALEFVRGAVGCCDQNEPAV